VASPTRNRSGAGPALRPNGGEGVALGDGQPLQAVQHGGAELVEAGVGQLHLRLHARRPGDLPAGDPVGQVAEQGGLAHARLAAQDHDAAATGVRVGQEPVERRTLGPASEELRGVMAVLARRWPPCARPSGATTRNNRFKQGAYLCDRA
jgi:hypothetical protein